MLPFSFATRLGRIPVDFDWHLLLFAFAGTISGAFLPVLYSGTPAWFHFAFWVAHWLVRKLIGGLCSFGLWPSCGSQRALSLEFAGFDSLVTQLFPAKGSQTLVTLVITFVQHIWELWLWFVCVKFKVSVLWLNGSIICNDGNVAYRRN